MLRFGFLFVLASILLGCATGPTPPADSTSRDPVKTKISGKMPSSSRSSKNEEPVDADDGERHQKGDADANEPNDAHQTAPAHPMQLRLPVDSWFVAQPLPARNPKRYSTFRQTSRIWVGESHLSQIDLFPEEKHLLVRSDDETTVRVYERSARRLLKNHEVSEAERFERRGVLAWPKNPLRFVLATSEGIRLVNAVNGKSRVLDERSVTALRWSPDERILVARREGKRTNALDFFLRRGDGLERLGRLSFPERVEGWDLSRDNRLLAVSLYPSNDLRVVDLSSGQDVARVPGPLYSNGVDLSPDGRWVAVGGNGLLLVDLVNPGRRAFHSHFGNNIHRVRFSPSGDALVASSYDGKLRVFSIESSKPALTRLRTLRHAGTANVYGFSFTGDGSAIVSVSGDQTIRTFSSNGTSPDQGAEERPRYRTVEQWREEESRLAEALPPPPPSSVKDGHYFPPRLHGKPHPSRIQTGRYACKITKIYKLRDCWVTQNEAGHTLLSFGEGNLLRLEGVLYDDGPNVRFEGWLAEPSNLIDCAGCEKQPIFGVFRGQGNSYRGVITFRNYHDPHSPPEPPPADVKIEEANDRYPVLLQFRGPLPERMRPSKGRRKKPLDQESGSSLEVIVP